MERTNKPNESGIIEIDFDGKEFGIDYYRVVTFHDGTLCLSIGDVFHTPISDYIHGLEDWDIVGNITDNPELMK